MRPLCYGMKSHPCLWSLYLFPECRSILFPIFFPTGFVLSLLCPNFYLGLWWVGRQWTRGNAVHERVNCLESGRASASMEAVSRESFTPPAAADAGTPTHMRATVADFHSANSQERPWPYRPCYDSPPLPLGRKVPYRSLRYGSVRPQYPTEQSGKVRYELDTSTRHFGKSVRPQYR